MTTLQEYLDKKYPTKEEKEGVTKIDAGGIKEEREIQGITELFEPGELDLREYVNVINLCIDCVNLTKLTLGRMPNLVGIYCVGNELTSIDFLNTLSNPEKLEVLRIFNNNIKSTDISIFSRFKKIKRLQIGITGWVSRHEKNEYNRFYGSLKSLKQMECLEELCIAGTDVNEGIEHLPENLAKVVKERVVWAREVQIDCQPHRPDAKVAKIQEELRPFDYDIEAWQLVHPEKMLVSRPELFASPDSRDKWLAALKDKIMNVREELINSKTNEADQLSKITRLETKIQELELAKSTIHQQTQTDFQTQNKSTQTDLTAGQIIQLEQKNGQLLKLLQATETELTNTKQQLQEAQKKLNNVLLSLHDLQSENKELIAMQTTIEQLQSKIKLLEQQKETYQEKYNHSLDFIKEIREDIAKM